MGDYIIEADLHPFQFRGPGMDPHRIIIIERLIELNSQVDNGIDKPTRLYLLVRKGRVPHEGGAAVFKISQIIGMIDDGRPIRIGIQDPVCTAVPAKAVLHVPYVAHVVSQGFRSERSRLHATPLNRMQQFVPPNPKAFARVIS
jgi:hypothetical protein